MKTRKMKKPRNPIAMDLLTPKYRSRIVERPRYEPKRRDIKSRLSEWSRSDKDGSSHLRA